MPDSQVTFDEWWADFHAGHPREDYFEALERLLRYADALSDGKRAAFVEGLVEIGWLRHGSSLAIGALERLAGQDTRRRVARAVETLPRVHPPHPLGDYRTQLLRVLATDPSGEHLAAVDSYCQDEIGPGFTSVVWALWPHQEVRFARYHGRLHLDTRLRVVAELRCHELSCGGGTSKIRSVGADVPNDLRVICFPEMSAG